MAVRSCAEGSARTNGPGIGLSEAIEIVLNRLAPRAGVPSSLQVTIADRQDRAVARRMEKEEALRYDP